MIIVVTGSPGTGKTSMVLDWIRKNHDGFFKAKYEDSDGTWVECNRPIYINHVDGVNHEFFNSQDISDDELMSDVLHNVVPCATDADPNVVSPCVIVDEAYRIYPNRPNSRAVPAYVEALAELRHHGLTLILICQQPSQLDPFVRSMAAKHYHIHRRKVGSALYQLYHCANSVAPSAFKDAIAEHYEPPKEVFQFYKSATMHVKFKKKLPKIFFIFPAIVIAAIIFIALAFGSVSKMIKGKDETASPDAVASAQLEQSNGLDPITNASAGVANNIAPQMADKDVVKPSDFAPRIIDKPETAPIYDGIRQVKSMESIAGCVKTKKACNCYSDQATKVNLPKGICEQILEDGIYNPYLPPPSERFAKKETETVETNFPRVVGQVGESRKVDLLAESSK